MAYKNLQFYYTETQSYFMPRRCSWSHPQAQTGTPLKWGQAPSHRIAEILNKKQLEAGQTLIKTEPKAPLIHAVIGKTSMKEKELIANITALIEAITPKKIIKLTICSSMSPGIRVDLTDATN